MPAISLTLLFWVEQNLASELALDHCFHLKHGDSYRLDFFMLGVCALVMGFLGLPASVALTPQNPLMTRSLIYRNQNERYTPIKLEKTASYHTDGQIDGDGSGRSSEAGVEASSNVRPVRKGANGAFIVGGVIEGEHIKQKKVNYDPKKDSSRMNLQHSTSHVSEWSV